MTIRLDADQPVRRANKRLKPIGQKHSAGRKQVATFLIWLGQSSLTTRARASIARAYREHGRRVCGRGTMDEHFESLDSDDLLGELDSIDDGVIS